jgi:hypothetical protein
MGFLSGIFGKGAKELIDGAGNIIDKIATDDEEKLKAKSELTNIVMTSLNTMQNAQRDVLLAEAKGNWLQRSWRPILMLCFGFIVIYAKFLAPAFNWKVPVLEPSFWTLLELGIGGYIIGRSVEKVAKDVTQNSDITFLRKRDRKDAIKG